MSTQSTIDLSDYLSQHYDELFAYLQGRYGSAQFAQEVASDLLFYLWNSPAPHYTGNPMGLLLSLASRLGNYRHRLRVGRAGTRQSPT